MQKKIVVFILLSIILSCNVLENSKQVTYNVIYDGNGNEDGDIPIDLNSYVDGDTVIVEDSGTVSKIGYDFSSWNTKFDGSGIERYPGTSFIMKKENITLFAQWSEKPTYKILYNGNGSNNGEAPVDSNNYLEGNTATIMDITDQFTKSGYIFTGWNTKIDGTGTSFISGDNIDISDQNINLYAQWKTVYYVIYNGNENTDGLPPIDSNYYFYEDTTSILDKPNNLKKIIDGISLTFEGWNTSSDGRGTMYHPGDDITFYDTDKVLYAQWSTSVIGGIGPAGGYIFYDNNNHEIDGWRYLEAAPSNWYGDGYDPYFQWGFSNINIGGENPHLAPELTGLGEGELNTVEINNSLQSTPVNEYAARYCYYLELNDFDDWYLPSSEELLLMANVLHSEGIGGFSSAVYYSSTEFDSFWCLAVHFRYNQFYIYEVEKSSGGLGLQVRPIRSF